MFTCPRVMLKFGFKTDLQSDYKVTVIAHKIKMWECILIIDLQTNFGTHNKKNMDEYLRRRQLHLMM